MLTQLGTASGYHCRFPKFLGRDRRRILEKVRPHSSSHRANKFFSVRASREAQVATSVGTVIGRENKNGIRIDRTRRI